MQITSFVARSNYQFLPIMKKIILYAALAFAALAMSCSSKQGENAAAAHEGHDHGAEAQMVLPEAEVAEPLKSYLAIKNALVQSNMREAKAAAEILAAHSAGDIQANASAIATAIDLDFQRMNFQSLSEVMYTELKLQGSSTPVYKQFCPMAFDNTGAHWLSTVEEIRNPYFGDKMLTCGRVDETIAAVH